MIEHHLKYFFKFYLIYYAWPVLYTGPRYSGLNHTSLLKKGCGRDGARDLGRKLSDYYNMAASHFGKNKLKSKTAISKYTTKLNFLIKNLNNTLKLD